MENAVQADFAVLQEGCLVRISPLMFIILEETHQHNTARVYFKAPCKLQKKMSTLIISRAFQDEGCAVCLGG